MLVVPSGGYRAADFMSAAHDLRIEVIVASDADIPMGDLGTSRSVPIDFSRTQWSASRIANIRPKPDAVIAVDDSGVLIAALSSSILGIPSNPSGAVEATRDKAKMRGLFANAGVAQPPYRLADRGQVGAIGIEVGFPCVVKPRGLSASRGVIRVDNADEATEAERRIRVIVDAAGGNADATLLVEEFVPGEEVAVEGMLIDGALTVLAVLDKPDPLVGPFFEETMFVAPSRHNDAILAEIIAVAQAATRALGLVVGPIHAELRLGPSGVVMLEIAARSIGGLCGRALTFGLLGESLESVILRGALGMPGSGLDGSAAATGVVMLPIPTAGTLTSIEGAADVLAIEGVTEFDQTIPNGKAVTPLPEGDRYLGFVFAQGRSAADVERALRAAQAALTITIEG